MKNKKILSFIPTVLLLLNLICPAQAASAGDMLVPVGQAVGIRLDCDGAVVSALAEISTETGTVCPARDAGICPGDRIIAVNGEEIHSGEEFLEKAAVFSGETVELRLVRSGRTMELSVTPRPGPQGWQLGIWLRSGIQGIGTVTYYDPADGAFGALGHGVSLPEGQGLLPISGGEILSEQVSDVVPGRRGEPGELCGVPAGDAPLGTVENNTRQGIFGTAQAPLGSRAAVPVASDGEIRPGKAVILSTIDSSGPREFAAEILRCDSIGADTRQLTLAVTDPALLSATGGIVQGMSGSPILQDGKLVGAITHVLVGDPSKGYGITMENMLRAAQREEAA